eukprot:TRINITY_DN22641_c0_g1_i1.p1 TRINITY_DN22641_c0_g1~~TRINITY_DN22641_c0_g1_i1.p1  ORF type:complete len:298 (+),score=75.62 TRINITY_DN22641_c0_g1_i1:54-947(+)
MAGIKRVGWVGTGIMGRWMAEHVLRAGYDLAVCTRTKAKAQPLLDLGAVWCDTPQAAAEGADAVVAMVGFPSEVNEVVTAALETLTPGGIVVDMSTSNPTLAVALAAQAKAAGCAAVDAPVSGGDVGARNAALTIFCGGAAADVEKVTPLFNAMGQRITHAGGPGAGQHLKLVNQILACTNIIGVCESLLYAEHAGLDPLMAIKAVGEGAAGGFQIKNVGPKVAARDFAPGFMIDHLVKDLGLAVAEARRLELTLPGLELAEELFLELQAGGHGQKGTQALVLALENMRSRRALSKA